MLRSVATESLQWIRLFSLLLKFLFDDDRKENMMYRYRWMLSVLLLAALLLSVVQPVLAQEEMERSGLRPDAPKYAIRGPHWVGYKPLVIGEGTIRKWRSTSGIQRSIRKERRRR